MHHDAPAPEATPPLTAADTPYALARAFPGHSEMARRMRGMDWAATTLGPVGGWSPNLLAALSLCLTSRFPMHIWWGPDLRLFYNDGYIPLLGPGKHPAALARSGREVWAEVWDQIRPMVEGVQQGAEATWSEDLLMFFDRALPQEEVYATFSFSPILSGDGSVEGLFCACSETTGRVVTARRVETLRRLGLATEAHSAGEACAAALRALDANPCDIPFARIEWGGTDRAGGALACSAALPGEDWDTLMQRWAPQCRQLHDSGAAQRVAIEPPHAAPWPHGGAHALLLPLRVGTADRPDGTLVLGLGLHRPFDAAYEDFIHLVQQQVERAIGEARSYEMERHRAETLMELDRAKTAFFSNLSHEFRTPITLMLGPLEEALAHAQAQDEVRGHLQLAHRNTLRLRKLVNNLLDFSRLQAGRAQARFIPVDLAALTQDLASNFRSAFERAGVALEVDCPPLPFPLYVDRGMWEDVVLNLLGNALKFTLQGSVRIALEHGGGGGHGGTAGTGSEVTLTVQDSGVGIGAAELPHIFERFRVGRHGGGRTQEGTGIGLALVQEIVHLHGGTVSAESTPGQGSVFRVRLRAGCAHLDPQQIADSDAGPSPLRAQSYVQEAMGWSFPDLPAPAVAGLHAPDDAAAGMPRCRVLVVDDNADMLAYVASLLSPHMETVSVPDGVQALEQLRSSHYDLMLADVMLPRMDGFSLLRAVRALPDLQLLPVILLSARAGQEAHAEGLAAGADDYVAKPFSARDLLARVAAALARARKRAETAKAAEIRYRQLFDAIDEGFCIIELVFDAAGRPIDYRFLEVNPAFKRHTGLVDAAGRTMRELIPDLDGEWFERYGRVATLREPLRFEQYSEKLDHRWFDVFAFPADDGQPCRVGILFTDISARKRAERALQHSERRLQETDRRKDEFLATLAHELRNPLAAISGAVELLRHPMGQLSKARAGEVLGRQVRHMVRLVDELLDVSRISRNTIELTREPLDLRRIAGQAIEFARPGIDERGHRLSVEEPAAAIPIEGDNVRLVQVLSNLLNNAARYTEPGGRITVRCWHDSAGAHAEVGDTGIGIPTDRLEDVFRMFAQVDRSDPRSKPGLGVGLALAQRLAQLHGGHVEARSAGPGQGSAFTLHLPVAQGTVSPPAPQGKAPAEAARLKVLVVDDDEDAAYPIVTVLEWSGMETQSVTSGQAALGLLERWKPDVALLDLGMPGMDGYTLARHMAATHPAVALIAISGWGQPEDVARCREAGFSTHFVKPVDLDAVGEAVRQVAQRH
ncbi:ATP-binding protein [Paracidovorax konjaci]|uniref:histidine kinase n=1 Tax=Paracidovorax konjaci TaxID=32040 RepID=A0A1I1TIE6_9BURK|nr:ATP-binding protein [Paracidovorax konjaci]SFD58384.1 PAS domain S-box-containing protein [Paracidovorax konjaci]